MRSYILFLAAAARLACAQLGGSPPEPSNDPFYTPPAGFENTAPGAVLNSRSVNVGSLTTKAWQILYRTTSLNGSAIATVTTVFKPVNAMLDRFVSFHTAEDSSWINCSPSYNYRAGSQPTDAIVGFEENILNMYVNQGYIVSSPDYEGPDSAFSAAHLAGMGVLDSMRAVTNFGSTIGFNTSTPEIVGIGYSGGGIATAWAAGLQNSYAPELPVKGWASGGTPANITGTLVYINGGTWSGFIPPAIVGMTAPSTYPELASFIADAATPLAMSYINYARVNCATNDIFNASNLNLLSYEIQKYGPELLYQPEIAGVLAQNTLGISKNETPIAPVYMYHASGDEIIPYSNATTLYNSWCDYGATVHFNTFTLGGHATTEIFGIPSVMSFVTSAFAGTVPTGCSMTSTDNTNVNLAKSLEVAGVSTSLAVNVAEALPIAALLDQGELSALTKLTDI